jgi:hypothetical protein
MQADPQKVLANVRRATTADLLDRVTVYRAGMEPDAVVMIEAELKDRGVGAEEIEAHRQGCAEKVLFQEDGIAAKCSFCYQPAVAQGWAMHRLWYWGEGLRLWRAGFSLALLIFAVAGGYYLRLLDTAKLTLLGVAGLLLVGWIYLGMPVFPRRFFYCEEHQPQEKENPAE